MSFLLSKKTMRCAGETAPLCLLAKGVVVLLIRYRAYPERKLEGKHCPP